MSRSKPQTRGIGFIRANGVVFGLLLAAPLIGVLALRRATPEEKEKSPTKGMLVQPLDLERTLNGATIRILDTRPKDAYDKGHIPGALRVDVASWQELGKLEGGFRDSKAWGQKVSELGIGADTRVVVYGNSLTDTARIWWTLKYLGLENVTVLDGGWDAWLREKRPAETIVPQVAAAQFVPKFDADRLMEIDPLKGSLRSGKVKVVDARSKDEFTGKELRGKRGGHITGATHLEWKELVAGDGRFKTPDQLRAVFRERGILPTETTVCY